MGWFRKDYQDSDPEFRLVDSHGSTSVEASEIKVKVKNPKTVYCSKYPYIDTIYFIDRENGILSNYKIKNNSSDVILCRSTSGFYNQYS